MMQQAKSLFLLLAGLAVTDSSRAAWEVNMTEGVTAVSRNIYGLHMTILIICVVIGLIVFGVMFYSIFKHRKSKGAVPVSYTHLRAHET